MTRPNRIRLDHPAWLERGFRPFFLGAATFAFVTMALWGFLYFGHLNGSRLPIAGIYWHAHEMLYGYVMAVIAGFLLTAVSNWTGRRTLEGSGLLGLFLTWMGARIAWLPGIAEPLAAMVLDAAFSLGLLFVILKPVVATRQWRQVAVISKVALLVAFNGLFYSAVLGHFDAGFVIGLHGGFYLVIGLILTLARRVVPFFIERALPDGRRPRNNRLLDLSSLVLFLVLFVAEVFFMQRHASMAAASGLFLVNAIRLWRWYVPGIWNNAMLWSLYVSQWAITLGFLAIVGYHLGWMPRSLAMHGLAIGGIALVTVSMMARVSLGHTGRSVLLPPSAIPPVFLLIVSALVVRVILPLFLPQYHGTWIQVSVLIWGVAFAVFVIVLTPVWVGERRGRE